MEGRCGSCCGGCRILRGRAGVGGYVVSGEGKGYTPGVFDRRWPASNFSPRREMSIGFFVDGAYVSMSFEGMVDYRKVRRFLEAELKDEVDEAYYFNATDRDVSPKVERFHNALAYPPPHGPGLRVKLYWLQTSLLHWPKAMGGGT